MDADYCGALVSKAFPTVCRWVSVWNSNCSVSRSSRCVFLSYPGTPVLSCRASPYAAVPWSCRESQTISRIVSSLGVYAQWRELAVLSSASDEIVCMCVWGVFKSGNGCLFCCKMLNKGDDSDVVEFLIFFLFVLYATVHPCARVSVCWQILTENKWRQIKMKIDVIGFFFTQKNSWIEWILSGNAWFLFGNFSCGSFAYNIFNRGQIPAPMIT